MVWIEALIAAGLLYGWLWLLRNWKRRTSSQRLRVLAYALMALGVVVYFWNGLQVDYVVLSLMIAAVAIEFDLIGVVAEWRRAGEAVHHPDEG